MSLPPETGRDISIKVPVYHHLNEGVFYIPDLRLTIYGKFINPDPTWIPAAIYKMQPSIFKIAPITKEYLTELFGRKNFDDVIFDLDHLRIQSPDFLRRLAKKVEANTKRITTHKGMANVIRKQIRRRMGI